MPAREHDVRTMLDTELDRARRHLLASLALARPGSPARVPILASLRAIEAEMTIRMTGMPVTS